MTAQPEIRVEGGLVIIGNEAYTAAEWAAMSAVKAKNAAYQAAYHQQPEVKAYQAAYQQRPEVKAKKAAKAHADRIARLEAKLAALKANLL